MTKTMKSVSLVGFFLFSLSVHAEPKGVFDDYSKSEQPKDDVCEFEGVNEREFPCVHDQCRAFHENRDPFIQTHCIAGKADALLKRDAKCSTNPCPGAEELVGFYTKASCDYACTLVFNNVTCDYKLGKSAAKDGDSRTCVEDPVFKNKYRPQVKWWKCALNVPSKNCSTVLTGQKTEVPSDKVSDSPVPGNKSGDAGTQDSQKKKDANSQQLFKPTRQPHNY